MQPYRDAMMLLALVTWEQRKLSNDSALWRTRWECQVMLSSIALHPIRRQPFRRLEFGQLISYVVTPTICNNATMNNKYTGLCCIPRLQAARHTGTAASAAL